MFDEQEETQAWLPAEATRGAEEGQQMFPLTVMLHCEAFMQVNEVELKY